MTISRGARPTTGVLTEALADALVVELLRRRDGGPPGGWSRYAGVQDPAVASAFDIEVEQLVRGAPWLRQAVRAACRRDVEDAVLLTTREQLVARLDDELRGSQQHVRLSLEAMLGVAGRSRSVPGIDPGGGVRTTPAQDGSVDRSAQSLPRRTVGLVARGRLVPMLWLNGIIGVVLAAGPLLHLTIGTAPPSGDGRVVVVSAAAVWALAFTPGWLFVRFLDRRAGSLWDEYVVHLHRLSVDAPGNLPEPPRSSGYHAAWLADGGLSRVWLRNLYQEKFDAYYGRSVSRFVAGGDRPVKPEALFPIFLCTAVLAVGWTAVLYEPSATLGEVAEPGAATMLAFGFMGGYVFFLQMLMRRYFQADLRAGAYVGGYVRTVVALLVVVALHAALPASTPAGVLIASAFVIGWFPDVGSRWLFRMVSRKLRTTVPSLDASYPLNRLDGLSVWYETRLLEEGIEDLENLVTAKIVDVLLHTRVPVARLVDWIDQGLLLLHLPPESTGSGGQWFGRRSAAAAAAEAAAKHPRTVLRECGVRSATGLERALATRRGPAREQLLVHLEGRGMPRASVLALHDVLVRDHRLPVVRYWQAGESHDRSRRATA